MNIDEAIKRLTSAKERWHFFTQGKEIEAAQMGIEALKEVKHTRSISFGFAKPLLPGETK